MKILKYNLKLKDLQTVMMYEGAVIFAVQVQFDEIKIWAYCDDTKSKKERKIAIHGTGHDVLPELTTADFIGTVQLHGGELVFHVFDLGYNHE